MLLTNRRFITIGIVSIMLTMMLTGCGGGLAATALKIAAVRAILPDKWSKNEHIVTLVADILGSTSLSEVIAHITQPDSSEVIKIVMTRNAEGSYEGSFEAPAGATQAETYTAVVTATDQAGTQATSSPVSVDVPPTSK